MGVFAVFGVSAPTNLRDCFPPGVLVGDGFVLPAAMEGYSVSFLSGGVDRSLVPATGGARDGVCCSCMLLGVVARGWFGVGFKLGEAVSRLLVLMSRLLCLPGRAISNTGSVNAPSSCLVGVLVLIVL